MNELAKYDAMLHAIAVAHQTDELITIVDQVIAMRAAAKIANNLDAENKCLEIRLRAERAVYKLTRKQKETVGLATGHLAGTKDGTGTTAIRKDELGGVSNAPPSLTSAGIDKNLAKRMRRVGKLSDDEFESYVKTAKKKRTTSHMKIVAAQQGIELTTEPPARYYVPREIKFYTKIVREIGKYLVRYDPKDLKSLKSACDDLSQLIDEHLNPKEEKGNVTWLTSTKQTLI